VNTPTAGSGEDTHTSTRILTTQTKLADLALLCSNCHRMIHRTKRWLTVEELKDLVAAQRTVLADALVPGQVD